jgi:hypothetical protein
MADAPIIVFVAPLLIFYCCWNLYQTYRERGVPIPFKHWGDLSGWTQKDNPKLFVVGVFVQVVLGLVGCWLFYKSIIVLLNP